ncbi:Transmembrane protein [Trichinella zimbabwensis]|uniref:Transmembrane protein 168 n=1 Tax=Trichinella zimbabwensis TaxID=268475 RepID=A0A0V1HA74_9BILA|nr:Transmembrane protein [Trichinella zimbabwensis]
MDATVPLLSNREKLKSRWTAIDRIQLLSEIFFISGATVALVYFAVGHAERRFLLLVAIFGILLSLTSTVYRSVRVHLWYGMLVDAWVGFALTFLSEVSVEADFWNRLLTIEQSLLFGGFMMRAVCEYIVTVDGQFSANFQHNVPWGSFFGILLSFSLVVDSSSVLIHLLRAILYILLALMLTLKVSFALIFFLVTVIHNFVCSSQKDNWLLLFQYGLISWIYIRPVMQFLFGRRRQFQCWLSVLNLKALHYNLIYIFYILLTIFYIASHILAALKHPQLVLLGPVFMFILIMWLLIHFPYWILLLYMFRRFGMASVQNCTQPICEQTRARLQLMNNGLRAYGTVVFWLSGCAMLSSLFLSLCLYSVITLFSFYSFLSLIIFELATVDLSRLLSNSLGGSCIAHALFIVQNNNDKLKTMENRLLQFFKKRMLYFHRSENLVRDNLKKTFLLDEINSFFTCITEEGLQYDSYFLYYNGPTDVQGNWQLKDDVFTLDDLLTCWRDNILKSNSRLLIMIDAENAECWLKEVEKIEQDDAIALQTRIQVADDEPGSADVDFTSSWLNYNDVEAVDEYPTKSRRSASCFSVLPRFEQSFSSSTFKFSNSVKFLETASFWKKTLPDKMVGLVDAATHLNKGIAFLCCNWPTRWRYFKSRFKVILRPNILDTDHDFVFCNSF